MSQFQVVATVTFETGEYEPDDASLDTLATAGVAQVESTLLGSGFQNVAVTVNRGSGTGNPRANDKVRVFRGMDSNGPTDWYWHRKSANGRIIATGGEGYGNKADCEAMARGINPGLPEDHYVVEDLTS